ncbi:replication factor C small subunit [Encephalitozoon hellem ATCC 50504]|uniref:DNA replication factor C n=1 Tax=Encephalitozoon hellem TaxID=27973 RepID=A0A9Q9C4R6_ENCHE|nr:replication factor C small subunit [Encephalitozoon hellem ATCC 50504]AFM99171.1 replication factor C small subunit [Encephalitozoon hellem ATCC 50504]UTX44156.1 DNA replication factor C [Encephalitozoon hellem]|eukprot:XP_003888152.1 replication factor C small subunit [Encephalitozoon hellem ATCC 50504]
MIWIEKYRPKSFDRVVGREEISSVLKSYTLETIPHMILHGRSGCGKKTTLLCLVNHLYGGSPETKVRTVEVVSGTKRIEVSYMESDEYVEISPSQYGHHDKAVIQSIIKEMGQTKPILSMLGGAKKAPIKLIAITSAEELTLEAQAALRRTIEMYSSVLRVVLICNELSRLIEPIRSRCFFLRIPSFSDGDIMSNMCMISEKENYAVPKERLEEICRASEGNMRRALCILELLCFNMNDKETKRLKDNGKDLRLDWELAVTGITSIIKSNQTPEGLIEIRKSLYTLLNSCISPRTILIELLRNLILGEDFKMFLSLSRSALKYEERIRFGMKSIYHLEGFITSSMCAFSEKKYS